MYTVIKCATVCKQCAYAYSWMLDQDVYAPRSSWRRGATMAGGWAQIPSRENKVLAIDPAYRGAFGDYPSVLQPVTDGKRANVPIL